MSRGAEPGYVLKVRINKIVRAPYGMNVTILVLRACSEGIPDGQIRLMYLIGTEGRGIPARLIVPLRPFRASWRGARRARAGTAPCPPGRYGGISDFSN